MKKKIPTLEKKNIIFIRYYGSFIRYYDTILNRQYFNRTNAIKVLSVLLKYWKTTQTQGDESFETICAVKFAHSMMDEPNLASWCGGNRQS